MEAVLLNSAYGFTTTNSVPKARITINMSKTKGNRVVGLTKERNVAQAEAEGSVKESALANEMKMLGVRTAIPPAMEQVRAC